MSDVRAKILKVSEMDQAILALRNNDIIGFPTETVYGLAGHAFSPTAVTKIFSAKARPSFDPLIVHVASELNSVEKLHDAQILDKSKMSSKMQEITGALISNFWPGPLTIILPKHANIPDLVTSGLDRVGIRMPSHPVAQLILKKCGLPLAAPSANKFGRISPTTAAHVFDELSKEISFIVDGGSCDIGVESTVVAVGDDRIWLLRPGKISKHELESCCKVLVETASGDHSKASPGMLASHYAPRKPLYLIDSPSELNHLKVVLRNDVKIGVLVTSGLGQNILDGIEKKYGSIAVVKFLSRDGVDDEAAQNLFSALRELDQSPATILIATRSPDQPGLWTAIQDRLSRASTKVSESLK